MAIELQEGIVDDGTEVSHLSGDLNGEFDGITPTPTFEHCGLRAAEEFRKKAGRTLDCQSPGCTPAKKLKHPCDLNRGQGKEQTIDDIIRRVGGGIQ